jgi:heterodisulfide reductase subunit A
VFKFLLHVRHQERDPSEANVPGYRSEYLLRIKFIQGRPSLITEDDKTHNLFVHSEDITLGLVTEYEYDMVMLNQAAVPQPDVDSVSTVLNIQQGPGGWFMEYHPKLRPIDSPTDGIFLAGACQGPKDIPGSVASGSATASRAGRILHSDEWEIEPIIAQVWEQMSRLRRMCGGMSAQRDDSDALYRRADPGADSRLAGR